LRNNEERGTALYSIFHLLRFCVILSSSAIMQIAISMVDGYASVERLDWNAFNETSTLQESVERYREERGYYPERILADKIYRTRENLSFCSKHGIRMNGPKLGRPPKDKKAYRLQCLLEKSEAGERNIDQFASDMEKRLRSLLLPILEVLENPGSLQRKRSSPDICGNYWEIS
jgi:hypothetical protein